MRQRNYQSEIFISLFCTFLLLHCSVVLLFLCPSERAVIQMCHAIGFLPVGWLTQMRSCKVDMLEGVCNWWRDSAWALFHWKLQTKHKLCSAHQLKQLVMTYQPAKKILLVIVACVAGHNSCTVFTVQRKGSLVHLWRDGILTDLMAIKL